MPAPEEHASKLLGDYIDAIKRNGHGDAADTRFERSAEVDAAAADDLAILLPLAEDIRALLSEDSYAPLVGKERARIKLLAEIRATPANATAPQIQARRLRFSNVRSLLPRDRRQPVLVAALLLFILIAAIAFGCWLHSKSDNCKMVLPLKKSAQSSSTARRFAC